MEDADLCALVRAAASSPEGGAAFGELYRRHRDVVMAQAYSMTRDRDLAEDLVADAFTRVLGALSRGRGPKESVLGYVLVTLRTVWVGMVSVEQQVEPVAPDELRELADAGGVDFAEALAERDQVLRGFATLPVAEREVLWLLDVEQFPQELVAELLGVTSGALRALTFRARKRLGTAYLQQYVEVAAAGCRPVAGLLAEYTRGSLGKRSAGVVAEHLVGCVDCGRQVDRLGSLAAHLRVWDCCMSR